MVVVGGCERDSERISFFDYRTSWTTGSIRFVRQPALVVFKPRPQTFLAGEKRYIACRASNVVTVLEKTVPVRHLQPRERDLAERVWWVESG